jgi:hypothetical protein
MQDEPTLQNLTRKKAMLEALEKHYGIVTYACKDVGISRVTHYDWLKEDPEYKAAVEDIDNVALDHTESKLHQLIEGVWMETKPDKGGETIVYQVPPNVSAVIYHLKTRGKKRGYIERVENITETHNNTGKVFADIDFSKLNDEELEEYITHQKRMEELESKIGTRNE